MLDWHAMRVGFVTQLLWERFGDFWLKLTLDAGADAVLPDRAATLGRLGDERVAGVPGLAFRIAVAQALTLSDADMIVAPSLNHGSESPRGSGQDPWIADFPAALGTLGGVPPVLAVPVEPSQEQEGLVVSLVRQLTGEAGMVKRLLDRHRAGLQAASYPAPRWGHPPPGRRGVAWLGQPWLLRADLLRAASREDDYPHFQNRLDPRLLREEGARFDERLIATDREVLGAARLFSRRAGIAELRLVVDDTSGADRWLSSRVREASDKELVLVTVDELTGGQPERLLGPVGDGSR